jgi:hypothetical protein
MKVHSYTSICVMGILKGQSHKVIFSPIFEGL